MKLDPENFAKTATPQRIFDFIVIHMANQGQRSRRSPDGGCMYRGPNGLKCAVGAVIPDDIYKPEMDGIHGFLLPALMACYDTLCYLIPYKTLLLRLQQAHDSSSNLNDLKTSLRHIARSHELKPAMISFIKEWK